MLDSLKLRQMTKIKNHEQKRIKTQQSLNTKHNHGQDEAKTASLHKKFNVNVLERLLAVVASEAGYYYSHVRNMQMSA